MMKNTAIKSKFVSMWGKQNQAPVGETKKAPQAGKFGTKAWGLICEGTENKKIHLQPYEATSQTARRV